MLTLEQTKQYLSVHKHCEDKLITSLMATAINATAEYLNVKTLDQTAAEPIKAAALLLVGRLYANGDVHGNRQLGRTNIYYPLLAPYRVATR
jgi:hypothetical protein